MKNIHAWMAAHPTITAIIVALLWNAWIVWKYGHPLFWRYKAAPDDEEEMDAETREMVLKDKEKA